MSKKSKWRKKLKKWQQNIRTGFTNFGLESDNYGLEDYSFTNFRRASTVTFAPTFKVTISAVAYKKLFSYVTASNLEVSGLGLVKQVENGFKIYDIFVLEQISSGAHTDLDKQAMAKLVIKLLKEKGEKAVNDLRFWWHSHPHFGVSPSGTDDATGERLANDKYLVSWIVNHNREIYCRIELTKPFRMTLCDVPIEIEGGKHKQVTASHTKEAQSKVKGYEYSEPTEFDFSKHSGNGYIWNNKLQKFVYTKQNLPLLRGADTKKVTSKGQWKEMKGSTLYVNPITKQNSYNKEEVKCVDCKRDSCGGCTTFQVLTKGGIGYGY